MRENIPKYRGALAPLPQRGIFPASSGLHKAHWVSGVVNHKKRMVAEAATGQINVEWQASDLRSPWSSMLLQ